MALDPRSFLQTNCEKIKLTDINAASDRKEFFGALGKIGNVEALNNIGASKVGQGLRTLAGISDSVRTGTGTPPTILGIGSAVGGSLDAGANWVLGNVGIAPGAVQAVGQFNPAVANTAYGTAKNVFTSVKQGTFTTNDIPNAFTDLQSLDTLSSNIFTPKATERDEVCWATPYAAALAYEFSPKQKFLFIVEFEYNPDFAALSKDIGRYTAYLVKTSTRPNVHFEYEEINIYNFRTRFPKKTIYDPMTMSFYDDNENSTMEFFRSYLNLISPVSNITQPVTPLYEQTGMGWDIGDIVSASLNVLPGQSQHKTVLNAINLYHLYDWGRYMNKYSFFNPKVLEMQLDELDMSITDATQVQLQFAYDGVYIQTNIDVSQSNIEELTNFGKYPIRYHGVDNGLNTKQKPQTTIGTKRTTVLSTGFGSDVTDTLSTTAQSLKSDLSQAGQS